MTGQDTDVAPLPPVGGEEREGLVHSTVQDSGAVIGPVCQWQPIETLPPRGERPGTVWVICEGSQQHSGVNWYRQKAGLARTHNEGFEDEDIRLIEKQDHMDVGTARVTHWLPVSLPPYPVRSDDRADASVVLDTCLNQALSTPSEAVSEAVERKEEIQKARAHAKAAHPNFEEANLLLGRLMFAGDDGSWLGETRLWAIHIRQACLVADALRTAVEAERERCAKAAETAVSGTSNISVHEQRGADKAAAAIRSGHGGGNND